MNAQVYAKCERLWYLKLMRRVLNVPSIRYSYLANHFADSFIYVISRSIWRFAYRQRFKKKLIFNFLKDVVRHA